MKKETLFICLLIFIVSITFISAAPPMPSAFYGKIMLNNLSFPNGYFLTAKINNVVSGECAILNSQYGYGENACIVVSYQSGLIEFFIGDLKIGEHQFIERDLVKLDFNLTEVPNYEGNFANGICKPELGECYFNILDCDASITNVCAGNNICDSLIGETCLNSVGDCGACDTESPSGSSGGGGGGSGGGGSSSSGSGAVVLDNTNEIISLSQEDSFDLSGLNTEDQKNLDANKEKGKSSFIKENSGTGIIILIFIILVVIYGVMSSRLKQGKKVETQVESVDEKDVVKTKKSPQK